MKNTKLITRVAGTALAVTAVVGTVAATAPEASAASGFARCPKGYFCVFDNANGTGRMAYFKNGDYNLGAAPGPSGMNNTIASAWNRSGKTFRLWGKPGYKGLVLTAKPGSRFAIAKGYRHWASSVNHK